MLLDRGNQQRFDGKPHHQTQAWARRDSHERSTDTPIAMAPAFCAYFLIQAVLIEKVHRCKNANDGQNSHGAVHTKPPAQSKHTRTVHLSRRFAYAAAQP